MKKNIVKPWLLVAAFCGLAAASIGISINTSGVFYTVVSNDLGIMRGSFAMHMTIFTVITGFGAFIVPPLMKKFRYKNILILSVVIAVLSTIAMGYVRTLTMFYLLGAIRGLSTSMFSIVPLTMLINNWFAKSYGTAISIVLASSGIAGAIGSTALSAVIKNTSWQTGYLVAGIIILVLCLPAILIPYKEDPRDEGRLPYGLSEDIKREAAIKEKKTFHFTNMTFISLCLIGIMIAFTTSMAQHFPGYAESINQASSGALMLSAGMIGNISSKIIIGILSDRLGAFKAVMTMMLIAVIGFVLIVLAKSGIVLIAGAFLFGASYSVGAVGGPILAHYFFDDELYNTIYPPINFMTNLGAAISLSAIGYIFDFFHSYSIAFVICIIMIVISMSLLFINKSKNHNLQ